MNSILFAIVMTLGLFAQAGTKADLAKAKEIIKTGKEPSLYIVAFEARGLKCSPIKDENIKLGKIKDQLANATVSVYCNEYDSEGGAMANVHILEFHGSVYINANFFIIDSMIVNAIE